MLRMNELAAEPLAARKLRLVAGVMAVVAGAEDDERGADLVRLAGGLLQGMQRPLIAFARPARLRHAQAKADLVLHLHDLAVAPYARGQALGDRLVARAFAAARTAGLTRLSLVAVQQSSAFWRRFGFAAPHHPLPPDLAEELARYGADACYLVTSVADAPSALP